MTISGTTRLAGVIGDPIRHSLSPAIFNAAFEACELDWAYLAFEVPSGQADRALDAMRALDIGGLSVTMPHKDTVAELVDHLAPEAAALHAVNCVVATADGLLGENTDGPGFLEALRAEIGYEVAGRRTVVIGAGGAARAIVLALSRAGASDVAVVNRTAERADTAAALAGPVGRVSTIDAIDGADLIVNATSVGMDDGQMPFDATRLTGAQVVADIVYHPSPTALVAAARERGIIAVDGLGMLVQQAGLAFRLWTGLEPPVRAMADAARAALSTPR
ncbi:MAG: shikimate dehydrogenase [Acidimicrobiaceae bacterium]